MSDLLTITAINAKHQKAVNAYLKADAKYQALVNADKDETPAGERAYNRMCEIESELPRREFKNIVSELMNQRGYF